VIFLNKKAFKIDELTNALMIEDKTRGDKEKTERSAITIERIQACYAEETAIFLSKKTSLTKFARLNQYGFSKSFYCYNVIMERSLAKKVYIELLLLTKNMDWKRKSKKIC